MKVKKGTRIDFNIPELLPQNYVDEWDGATIVQDSNKKKAYLVVEKDCTVVAYVGAHKYKMNYSILDGVGGKLEIEGLGSRPVDDSKATIKDKWEHKKLTFDGPSPITVNGGDKIYFIPKPDAKHAVDYWLLKEGKGEQKKDYTTQFELDFASDTRTYKKTFEIKDDWDVVVKFRDYYLLNCTVFSGDNTGTLEVTKIERNGAAIQLADWKKNDVVLKTDIAGNPVQDDNGKPVILGYKIQDGDIITFKATPAQNYKVQQWTGFKYDNDSFDESQHDPTPTVTERSWTAKYDLDIKVVFEQEKKS